MPVVRTSKQALSGSNRPEWCQATSAGIFRIPLKNGSFDCHYHDCNEYWLIFRGRAKIATEGHEFYVGPGDIVCTEAGDEHDVLEVYEEFEAFWFEEAIRPGGRLGHLHRDAKKTLGHPVPAYRLPDDFPL